jgi:hypothetical protein
METYGDVFITATASVSHPPGTVPIMAGTRITKDSDSEETKFPSSISTAGGDREFGTSDSAFHLPTLMRVTSVANLSRQRM